MSESASFEELTRLKASLDGALAGLENVDNKRLFGCDACFVQGNIFALVWKDGRLGLRLSEAEAHAELLAQPGAELWQMDGKAVKHWVLLPKAWAGQASKLRDWGRRAYALASARPAKLAKQGRAKDRARTVKAAVFKKVKRPGRG